MTRRDTSRTGKLVQKIADYAKTYCTCGHSLVFKPSTPYKYCNYCHRKVINDTKGRFLFKLYETLREMEAKKK